MYLDAWIFLSLVSGSLCQLIPVLFFSGNWSIVYNVVAISAVTWLTYTHIDILFFNIPFHYGSSQDIIY